MKNRQFSKIAILALSLVLMVGAIFALTANAATTPEITNMNVKYTDKFCLVYAVPADTVQGGSATLYLYDEDPATGADPIKDYTVTKTTPAGGKEVGGVGLDYEAYVFYTDGVAALALDKVFYAQVIDANNNKSDVVSYSVVEYLYTRLADVDGKANTAKQNNLYKTVIAFGTAAQEQFLEEDVLANTTLISDYFYLTATGCTVDGKTEGVFPQNKTFEVQYSNSSVTDYTLTTYAGYTNAEEESVNTIHGTALNVSNGNRIHIAPGKINRTYKDGVLTFEGETVGSAPSMFNASSGALNEDYCLTSDASGLRKNTTIVEDTVFGEVSKVIKVVDTAAGRIWASAANGLTGDDVTSATAIEFSFDIKVDTSGITDSTWETIEGNAWPYYNFTAVFCCAGKTSNRAMNNVRFSMLDNGTMQIDLIKANQEYSTEPVESLIVPVTVFAGEYNSFRLVARVDEETKKQEIDIYVNNFTDTPDATFESSAYDSTYKALVNKVTDLDKAAISMYPADTDGAIFYIDNIWCGYTAE